MDANKIDSIATKVGGALKNLRINMNLAPVFDPPKDIPVTMMSSVQFTHISDRPAVFDENIVKMARQYAPDMVMLTDDLWGTSLRAWAGEDFKRPIAAIIDAGNDIIMISYTSKAKNMLNIMMELSESDSKYKSRIEKSAARILKLKYEMGILKL
ncbi:MAG: hypothetical protein SPL19_07555 [Fibrobacter sp.]|nr:hypothetical protein [Fibrobacter sp.]MDY6370512.1 hypothetical protein [Fibrobacter sp.]MDY6390197.1 hypothetical protein [Fibrobacter sp.]